MKDWQQGYDLATLKSFAAPFAEAYKPFVFGAFGIPKERDIALALSEDRLTWIGSEHKTSAIFRLLVSPSTQTDFTGRRIQIPARSISISHVVGQAEILLVSLREKAASFGFQGAAVEIFEEDFQLKRQVRNMGFEYAFSKVMAGSEVKGVYYFGIPKPEPLSPLENASLIKLAPSFLSARDLQAIRGELRDLAEGAWAQHYSSYNKRKSWTAFALRGYRPKDPSFIVKPAEMSKDWKEKNAELLEAKCTETIFAALFPQTLKIVARLPGAKDRVRLMRLAGGGELSRHADVTDREAGLADGRVTRLHIPIVTSPEVLFQGWDAFGERHEMHFEERGLFYLDQRKPHRVTNPTKAERIHLVIDCYSSPELRALFPEIA